MAKTVFTGAATAIVTPFTEYGVNFDVLEELIEIQIAKGIDGIVICGTTGESSTMPDDEHKSAIKFCVEKVNGRIPVIAGAGSNDTNHAVHLSKYAQEVGADAVLSVTPYYNKTTQNGLYEHFKTIAESIDIPIILYNVPTRTVLNINPETQRRLSLIENIAGVKECNIAQVAEVAYLCGENYSIYAGDDFIVLPLLALGGKGVISVASNVIPHEIHEIVSLFLSGEISKSRSLMLKYFDLMNAFFLEVNPVPIKTALAMQGYNVGKCRLPLVDMEEKNVSALRTVMQKHGLL
jgi:4-hydroxy-tetrahydrodipicolinate synthase